VPPSIFGHWRCYRAAVRAPPARPPRRALVACAVAAGVASVVGVTAAVSAPADNPATDGQVFAGVTGADPANVATNAATLIRLPPGVRLFALGTVALDQFSVQRRLVSATGGALSTGPRVDDANVGVGFNLGIVYTFPRGAFSGTVALRPPDETIVDEATGYHSLGSRSRRIDWFTLAGGFKPTSWLYLGLSATVVERHQRIAFARDSALDAGRDPARGIGSDCAGLPCGLENPAARELWTVDVASADIFENLTYSVGALARLPAGVWVGAAAVRPWQAGTFAMTGDAEIVAAPRDGGATLRGEAVVVQRLPEVWRLGARGPVTPEWELVGELRWRRLWRTDPIDVRVFGGTITGTDLPEWQLRPNGVHDAYAADLGLEQIDFGQRWRFGGKLGVDTGATAANRLSARAPWGPQLSAALGAQVRLDRWILQVGYRVDAQLPTSSDPSAFDPLAAIACIESDYDYDLPACATLRAGYGTSTGAGTYGRFSHTARVVLQLALP